MTVVEVITQAQDQIDRMLKTGATLDTIDERVIEPAPLSTDQKAALWLYAWSCASRGEQRRMASQHLADVSVSA